MLYIMTERLATLTSPAIARTLTATVIAVILVAANFTVINAQQQQPLQLESISDSGGGLTATINSDSFATGETITISGSVAQRGSSSNVVIEITDPQGQLVKRGFPALTPTKLQWVNPPKMKVTFIE